MKTLVYSIHGFDKPFLENNIGNRHQLVFTEQALNTTTANMAAGHEAVSLFTGDVANAEVLDKLYTTGVRYIALRSVGYDHVDLEKARSLGIKVANVPAYSPYAIAEHSVALLLALNRKLFRSRELMSHNDFRLDELVGFDLFGKTVGIVGTGKIGAAFARIMNGFGCKLIACDPIENELLKQETALQYGTLTELCRISDVIAIHCPLNQHTKHLFDKALFRQMKKGVFFINTARGAITDTEALLEAIDHGTVAAAGLDVYEFEKPIYFKDLREHPVNDPLFERLRNHPKIILTGHQAFLTNEALQGIAETTRYNLDSWERSGSSVNDL